MTGADIVIVGAGPAGSAAATVLAGRGLRVLLVDRAHFPRDKPCGDYCNPGAVRLLETLGLLSEAGRFGGFIDGMMVSAQDGSAFNAPFPAGRGLLIPRTRLDASLLDRAARAGAEIVEGYRVDEVVVDGMIRLRGAGRTELRGRMLIASDGMRSVVARRLGLLRALPQGRYTIGAYVSSVPGPAAGELHLGPGLYGGVARFGDGTANVCLALPRALFRGRSAEATFEAGLRALPALADSMQSWHREGAFRISGPVGFASHAVTVHRSLLAGDAAGQIEPLTGQGISFALRSGIMAADHAAAALERGAVTAQALHAYARARAAVFNRKLRMMRVVTALALQPDLAPPLMRRLAARPALAAILLGAAGDLLPPEAVLSPRYLIGLLLGSDAHAA